MPRLLPVLVLLAALGAAGCRPPGAAVRPQPKPTPTVRPGLRVGVVDVDRVARAHPRWPELDALNKKLADLEVQLAVPPQAPPLVADRLEAQLRAQAKQLEAEFQAEMASLRQRQEAALERYAASLQDEQTAKLDRLRAQVEAELKQTVEARAAELRAELRRYEAEVLDEYRFPIANLRLKAAVIGVASEEELRQLTGELERLLNERDAKVRARAELVEVILRDFEKARVAEANGRLARAQREAEREFARLVAAKRQELEAETRRLLAARRRAFEARLEAFRRRLLSLGESQLAAAQSRYAEGLREREQQLLAERQALTEQRARLEDVILSDVKIEVAALAAARGFDVVLTRYLSNLTGEDLTAAVLGRLKR